MSAQTIAVRMLDHAKVSAGRLNAGTIVDLPAWEAEPLLATGRAERMGDAKATNLDDGRLLRNVPRGGRLFVKLGTPKEVQRG